MTDPRTLTELADLLDRLGASQIVNDLRRVKTPKGCYRYGPSDPIEGPYSGDEHDKASRSDRR